jgi:hypothetical protein
VSKTAGSWFDIALGSVSLVLLGCAVFAVVLCVRRSLAQARTIAARTFWRSVLTAMLATCAIPFVRTAESMSQGAKMTLPATLAMLVAVAAWVVAVVAGARPTRDE